MFCASEFSEVKVCDAQKIEFIQSDFCLAGKPCNQGTLDSTKALNATLLIYIYLFIINIYNIIIYNIYLFIINLHLLIFFFTALAI